MRARLSRKHAPAGNRTRCLTRSDWYTCMYIKDNKHPLSKSHTPRYINDVWKYIEENLTSADIITPYVYEKMSEVTGYSISSCKRAIHALSHIEIRATHRIWRDGKRVMVRARRSRYTREEWLKLRPVKRR